MSELKENVVEWVTGSHYAWWTLTDRKLINRMKTIYKERKDEFKHYKENEDGSLYICVPKKWLKANPGSKTKRELTEEQKAAMVDRMHKARMSKTQ